MPVISNLWNRFLWNNTHYKDLEFLFFSYKVRNYGIVKALVQYHTRLPEDELSWERQIAACRIQLAWRRHHRRKLLKDFGPIKKYLHTWHPDFVRLKQNVMMQGIYSKLHAYKWNLIYNWVTQQLSAQLLRLTTIEVVSLFSCGSHFVGTVALRIECQIYAILCKLQCTRQLYIYASTW